MGGSPEELNVSGSLPRKRPRKCIACGNERPKGELLRVTRTSEGDVAADPTGKAPGRGAYVCANMKCVDIAQKKNALSRAFKHPVDAVVYIELKSRVELLGLSDAD